MGRQTHASVSFGDLRSRIRRYSGGLALAKTILLDLVLQPGDGSLRFSELDRQIMTTVA